MENFVCRSWEADADGITAYCGLERVRIDFALCAQNFAAARGLSESRCVAARDAAALSFTFYTARKTTFVLRGLLAARRFHRLQGIIARYGYSTYDDT